MNIKSGDLLLFKDDSFGGKIVQFFSGGKYVHSAIARDDEKYFNVNEKGISKELISKLKNVDVYRPRYNNEKCKLETLDYLRRQLKVIRGYDFINFMAFTCIKFLRMIKCTAFEGNDFVICSELCADALDAGDIHRIGFGDMPTNSLLTPTDLTVAYAMDYVGAI